MKLNWAMKLPEAWRLLRICWRPKRIATVAILSIVVSSLVTAGFMLDTYRMNIEQTQRYVDDLTRCNNSKLTTIHSIQYCKTLKPPKPNEYPLKEICYMMLFLQAALLLVAGTFITGASMYSEFDKDTWILQQTTPQSPRKLLLGKILGAPGDLFVISAANMPFLVTFAALGHVSFVAIAKTFLMILLLCAIIYTLVLLLLVVQGKTKSASTSLVIGGLLCLIAVGTLEGELLSNSRHSCDNSHNPVAGLNPGCVVKLIYYEYVPKDEEEYSNGYDRVDNLTVKNSPMADTIEKQHKPVTDFHFYGFNIGGFIFAMLVYLVFALWMFMAAESELRRRMSISSSRLYLPVLFFIMEFLYVGFSQEYRQLNDYEVSTLVNSMMLVSMLYFVIFTQLRDKGELRPWVYRTAGKKSIGLEYFASDAPPIYTIVACILIAFCGIAANAVVAHSQYNIIFVFQFSTLAAIVLRDSFIFQTAKMSGKKGVVIAAVLYVIAFCAIPALAAIMFQNFKFDLSPVTAIGSSAFAGDVFRDHSDDSKAVLFSYIPVNGALAVLFFCIHSFLINKTRRGLEAPETGAAK